MHIKNQNQTSMKKWVGKDENGIILIPNTLNLAMLKKSIDEIGEREKRWFNELKNKKMNTFEIVCK